MKVKDLLPKTNYNIIYRYLKKYSPYTNDFEYEALSHKKQIKIKNVLKRKYYEFYKNLKQIKDIKYTDNILVISKLHDDNNGYESGYYYSPFYVKKSEVSEKLKKGNITLWNGDEDTRIEHYAIDYVDIEELLGYEICPNTLSLNYNLLIAIILIETSRFGFTKEQKDKNLDNLATLLEESIKNIDESKTCTLEEFDLEMDKWHEKILGRKETEDEKIKRKKEKEQRQLRTEKIMNKNHLIVINDVKSIIEKASD